MEAKQKAIELMDRFKKYDYDYKAQGNEYCVIQYSIISVNEIIDCILNEDNKGKLCDEHGAIDYWNNVKQELTNFL